MVEIVASEIPIDHELQFQLPGALTDLNLWVVNGNNGWCTAPMPERQRFTRQEDTYSLEASMKPAQEFKVCATFGGIDSRHWQLTQQQGPDGATAFVFERSSADSDVAALPTLLESRAQQEATIELLKAAGITTGVMGSGLIATDEPNKYISVTLFWCLLPGFEVAGYGNNNVWR